MSEIERWKTVWHNSSFCNFFSLNLGKLNGMEGVCFTWDRESSLKFADDQLLGQTCASVSLIVESRMSQVVYKWFKVSLLSSLSLSF